MRKLSDTADPWLPLPDGWRLVTDQERRKYNCPGIDEYKFFFDGKWCEPIISTCNYWTNVHHAVPVDHVWAEDKIEAARTIAEHDTEHVYNCQMGGYATLKGMIMQAVNVPNELVAHKMLKLIDDQPTAQPPIEPLVYSPHNDVKNMVDTMKRVNELTEIINHLNKEVE